MCVCLLLLFRNYYYYLKIIIINLRSIINKGVA